MTAQKRRANVYAKDGFVYVGDNKLTIDEALELVDQLLDAQDAAAIQIPTQEVSHAS